MIDIEKWQARYAEGKDVCESTPEPLLVRVAQSLPPGCALDLACGVGRNAVWLAHQGWQVTAVDGSSRAIDLLRINAEKHNLFIDASVTDLTTTHDFIGHQAWNLIVMSRYLQRDLFPLVKRGLKPKGVFIAIALMTRPGEEPTYKYATDGELAAVFADWEILEYSEIPHTHRHTAELAVRAT